jgi:hypothetical protein
LKLSRIFFLLLYSCLNFAQTLDELGVHYNTDKSSLFHHYTKIYEKYFDPIKEKPLKFLEIGFSQGCSARMWEDYFSNADLYFIDINPETLTLLHDFKRTRLFLVDQENPAKLLSFINDVGGDFDMIIDDGGHTMKQQITSFKTLFPFVKSGGIYIIEDLHTSYTYVPYYADGYGTANPNQETAVQFLQNLVHAINYPGAHTGCADYKKCRADILAHLTEHEKEIESIHFYSSLCFIFKK